MIGIICAMAVEVADLKERMENPRDTRYAHMTFTTGAIGKNQVTAVECGVGKVNAAMCAQIMIDRFNPEIIINSGVAGAVCADVAIGDTVIATQVLQHDMNASALGDPLGEITFPGENRTYFPCDNKIIDSLEKACLKQGSTRSFKGRIASGDIFVSRKSKRSIINLRFNALACEMEGGAVGQVCFCNGVPFGVFRVISDDFSNNKGMDFSAFCKTASEKSIKIITSFIEDY